MSTHLSKLCADHLRAYIQSTTGQKLKASHARELVAAFFGYKSHAALLADTVCPVDRIEEARYFLPDEPLLKRRTAALTGLPPAFPQIRAWVDELVSYLESESYFTGTVWRYDSLSSYVAEVLLIEEDSRMLDLLSGVMAETNAYFDDPFYEVEEIQEGDDGVLVRLSGTYGGTSDPDRPFCGDQIDVGVEVRLFGCAGRRLFTDYDISAGGSVNDDWVDHDLRFGSS